MDWTALGLKEKVVSWLEEAAQYQRASEVRLDPFSTSMRDFDDVTPNLISIRAGNQPNVNDAGQRITDLKKAGFVGADGKSLTELGTAVLTAWSKYGVATELAGDEFARLLLMVLEGRRLADPTISEFLSYWEKLRGQFDPLELIENWDSLYAINYLDYPRNGFAPGTTYRDEGIAAKEIEFDLGEYARSSDASDKAHAGAQKIENAISAKIPRGRHRATFCMALEIVVGEGENAPLILDRFGTPKRPRDWNSFSEAQKEKIRLILADVGMTSSTEKGEIHEAAQILGQSHKATAPSENTPYKLPEQIDFTTVLVNPPAPKVAVGANQNTEKGSGPRKIDYQQKAASNAEVGKLAESFALAYEKWRLREQPELQKKLRQVSSEDDTLGYDIESFELDGSPRFVEVKGTIGPLETRFFLTANEMACAGKYGDRYVILRVGQLVDDPKCCELRHPFKNLELSPAIYSAVFKSTDVA